MSDLLPSTAPIQRESTRFRSSVSEALLQGIGGLLNYLRISVLPVGSYAFSALTEAQYQDQTSTGWVLADGRGCAGSAYALLTGNTSVPDARGVVLRGKNNGRASGTGNQSGELALGTYQGDAVEQHTHSVAASQLSEVGGPIVHDDGSEFAVIPRTTTGGMLTGHIADETRVRSVTTNIFFRID